MSRVIKFHAFNILFRLFAYLADKSGGWLVFVRPKLLLGSLIVGLGLTSCGTKTEKKTIEKNTRKVEDTTSRMKTEGKVERYDISKNTKSSKKKNGINATTTNSSDDINNAKSVISISCYLAIDIDNMREIDTTKNKIEETTTEYVYTVVEQMPQFPGGEKEIQSHVDKNLTYPVIDQENGIQGKVVCRFVVSKTGEISRVEVLRSIDTACDKEAIRVIKSLPNFIPGKQNGVNVSVWYTIPIVFKLPK